MKKQNGITLIALVISIIVMLILAGVSINAIVGENGVLSRAQYSSFLNEMATVEEAVQLWKAGELIESKGQVSTAIPANGLCNVNELTATERLVGEIGYYRTWSIGNTMPDMSILTSADAFNKKYEGEFVFYPAGVQDLYYLNNEALGLDEGKVYLIDASTSMIYSMSGITLNGVRCYSLNMAKAVLGNNVTPLFVEAEVSGTGTGDNLAGNVQDEFLPDGTKNPNYNPNGFKFISSRTSDNIYKLYNNGDLFVKGVKGTSTNATSEEINSLSRYNWVKWDVPEIMKNKYKRILYGNETIFFIDNDNYLWAYGENKSNKLGLDSEQLKEYTGREPIQLKITNSNNQLVQIKEVFSYIHFTYVVTIDNEVYVAGINNNGSQGVGNTNALNKFEKVLGLPQENIKTITVNLGWNPSTLTYILYENGDVYGINSEYIFEKIIDSSEIEEKYNSYITQICYGARLLTGDGLYILLNNGYIYKYIDETYTKIDGVSDIVEMPQSTTSVGAAIVAKNLQGNIYVIGAMQNTVENMMKLEWSKFCNEDGTAKTVVELSTVLPETMIQNDKVKDMLSIDSTSQTGGFAYIMESGDVWATDKIMYLGLGNEQFNNSNVDFTEEIKLIIDADGNEGISTLNNVKIVDYKSEKIEFCSIYINRMPLIDENGNLYITDNSSIMYGNDILQTSWKKVASNVSNAWVFANELGYIDDSGYAYILSDDYRNIGEESLINISESNFKKVENVTNVKEIIFSVGSTFLLTNNNKLYSAGRNKYTNDLIGNAYNGFGEEAITKQTLLKENVSYATGSGSDWSAEEYIISDGKLYFLGQGAYGPFSELGRKNYYTMVEVNTSSCGLEVDKIKKIVAYWEGTAIITTDGELYIGGSIYNTQVLIGGRYLTKVDLETYGIKGKVIDVVNNGGYSNFMILTDIGELYGIGVKSGLGIDVNSTEFQKTPIKVLDNVASIDEVKGAYIAIKKDGTVWGTGTNTYGILGRWIGIDRNSPNSRYKTALTWVECPELEI